MAKWGQGIGRATLNRAPDEIYRAVMPQSPAISQPVPGDLGTVSPQDAHVMTHEASAFDQNMDAIMRDNSGLSANQRRSLDERSKATGPQPQQLDQGMGM